MVFPALAPRVEEPDQPASLSVDRIFFVKEAILTSMSGAQRDKSRNRLAYITSQAACADAPAPWP